MKKILYFPISIFILFSFTGVLAQSHKCGTMENLQKNIVKNPHLKSQILLNEKLTQEWITNHRFTRNSLNEDVITIPVVVHVIWHDSIENVSDSQILSQLDALNKDFRLLNPDSLDSAHPFYGFISDSKIEFCLAKQDPQGNPTSGITRTETQVVSWDEDSWENIKFTSSGGKDNWDPNSYLNLYVVNLQGTTLGFATFPDELSTKPELDGVVIRYEAFGTEGTAGSNGFTVNAGGRTATHEVGHWLNLRHIWGDTLCGDDFVNDTKYAEESNYDCPNFPHKPFNLCNGDENGEMFMNYMDYVDDNCMNMFTIGQSERMRATLNSFRKGLLISTGCQKSTGTFVLTSNQNVTVSPNPSSGLFSLTVKHNQPANFEISIIDLAGYTIQSLGTIDSNVTKSYSTHLSPGMYILKIANEQYIGFKKIIISK